ncbi:hypothetical protein F4779DRAFT_109363 [Xylariaceae sp. FL0662B]|nr:hypothetical protein F4779DRAFT_109363 [Xylariaceae sp. FL0662B]
MMALYPHLDRQTALSRLGYEIFDSPNRLTNEEHLHPWRASYFLSFPRPLLRIWDTFSGSQPEADNRMLSRAPEMSLDDWESRRASLAQHLHHGTWIPGPYISFTTSPTAVEDLARWRAPRRGDQILTVIDPNVRMKNGLPVLRVEDEMHHYGIQDPYGKPEYHVDHYACLWQVTEAEIIGHWDWCSLIEDKIWYYNQILPAFRRFKEISSPAVSEFVPKLSIPDDPSNYSDSSEEVACLNDNSDWDTDDEVEETNAADDMIKIVEGDW